MDNNKFFRLLMGECIHEWKATYGHVAYTNTSTERYDCLKCGKTVLSREETKDPDYLSDPLIVIRWMEKEMPEVWEKFLLYEWVNLSGNLYSAGKMFKKYLNKTLDPNNLVTYLSEYQEWGWKECNFVPECSLCSRMADCDQNHKIKHPALVYLEEEDGV